MDETVTAQVLGDGTIRIKDSSDNETEPIDLSVDDARNLQNQLNRLIDNIERSTR